MRCLIEIQINVRILGELLTKQTLETSKTDLTTSFCCQSAREAAFGVINFVVSQ
jgi:hypothetical protein